MGAPSEPSSPTRPSPSGFGIDATVLSEQLTKNKSIYVGKGKRLPVFLKLIKGYEEALNPDPIVVGASLQFLTAYIDANKAPVRDQLKLDEEYPLLLRQKAENICHKYFCHVECGHTDQNFSRMRESFIWVNEGIYQENPTHWLCLYDTTSDFELQQQLFQISLQRLEDFLHNPIDYKVEQEHLCHMIAILKLFSQSYGPQIRDEGRYKELYKLIKRASFLSEWFKDDGQILIPKACLDPRVNVAPYWDYYVALGFDSFENFAVSNHQALRPHLLLEHFSKKSESDQVAIARVCCLRLVAGVDDQDEYPILKKFLQGDSKNVLFGGYQDIVDQLEWVLKNSDDRAALQNMEYDFKIADKEKRLSLGKALQLIMQHETAESYVAYAELAVIYEQLRPDYRFDSSPQEMMRLSQDNNFDIKHYYLEQLNPYLKLDNYLSLSPWGKQFIIKAVLLRLTRAKLDPTTPYTSAECADYFAILKESSYWHSCSVQEVVSWFEENGKIQTYPQWWLNITSLREVCQRAVIFEFDGSTQAFFVSNHWLANYILALEKTKKELSNDEIKLRADLAVAQLNDYLEISKEHGRQAADKRYSAERQLQLLGMVSLVDQSFAGQWHQQKFTLAQNSSAIEIPLHSQDEINCQHHHLVNSEIISEKLMNYYQLDLKNKYLLCFAALARLQYQLLVSEKFNSEQLYLYLNIIEGAQKSFLNFDASFCEAVKRIIPGFIKDLGLGHAKVNHQAQQAKEQQLCRVVYHPKIQDYLQLTSPLEKFEMIKSGLGEEALKRLADISSGEKSYIDSKKLHSPWKRVNSKSVLSSVTFWGEQLEPAGDDIVTYISIAKQYIASELFDGDRDEAELILDHFTGDGIYDHRFVMYEDYVSRRFEGDSNAHIKRPPADRDGWSFEGPNEIKSFLTEANYNEGSVLRKILFLKAMICHCESAENPQSDYLEMMEAALEDRDLMSRLSKAGLKERISQTLEKNFPENDVVMNEKDQESEERLLMWDNGITLFSNSNHKIEMNEADKQALPKVM